MKRFLPFLLMSVAWASPALGGDYPKPQGWVNDFAGVLKDATRQTLQREITETERETTAEVAVVTVPSLQGQSVEIYANKLFKEWGIGKKGKNNGVLILVAPQDHRMRIEVGYGLEAILPDGLAGEIIRQQMTPAFKAGDFDRGILEGTERVLTIIQENKPASFENNRQRDGGDFQALSPGEKCGVLLIVSAILVFGFAVLGAGMGSKTVIPILLGMFFGGLPMLGFLTMDFGVFRFLIGAEVAGAVGWGFYLGRQSNNIFKRKRLAGRHTDGWTFGPAHPSKSSIGTGGSGGGFGGGFSGGGGASGSW